MKKIGVFDSGVGGLSILRSLVKNMPEYGYIYFGDSLNAPYGDKSEEDVMRFTEGGVNFLFEKGARIVILACNTASAETLRYLQNKYPNRKILGVLIPGAEEASSVTRNGRIGVIGTTRTVSSKAFEREILKISDTVKVFQKACPSLVPAIEAGDYSRGSFLFVLKEYIDPLVSEGIDTLLLGCTHYEHIEDMIREILPEGIEIVSESSVVADKLKAYLIKHSEIERDLDRSGELLIYTSDKGESFENLARKFFGKEIIIARRV